MRDTINTVIVLRVDIISVMMLWPRSSRQTFAFAHRMMLGSQRISPRRAYGNIVSKHSDVSPSSKNDWTGKTLFYGLSGLCLSLGVWQIQRRARKIQIIADREKSMSVESKHFATVRELKMITPYSLVEVNGEWMYDQTVLIGPRSAPRSISAERDGSGRSAGGIGYYIVTPLRTTTGTVLVNRGWIAKKRLEDCNNIRERKTSIVGIVRPGEQGTRFVDVSKPFNGNQWLFLHLPSIIINNNFSHEVEKTFFIDAIDDSNQFDAHESLECVCELVRKSREDFTEFPTSPIKHTIYAGTWFFLGVAGFVMTTARFKRARKIH